MNRCQKISSITAHLALHYIKLHTSSFRASGEIFSWRCCRAGEITVENKVKSTAAENSSCHSNSKNNDKSQKWRQRLPCEGCFLEGHKCFSTCSSQDSLPSLQARCSSACFKNILHHHKFKNPPQVWFLSGENWIFFSPSESNPMAPDHTGVWLHTSRYFSATRLLNYFLNIKTSS